MKREVASVLADAGPDEIEMVVDGTLVPRTAGVVSVP